MTLEERVQRLEDLAAITQLVAAYGPAVDSGSTSDAAGLFADDAVYDVMPAPLHGAQAVHDMVAGRAHQGLIAEGCAHVMGLPRIDLDGDSAVVVNHSVVFRRTPQGFEPWRVSANRWVLARTSEGWRVTERVNRPLDGSVEARELLRQKPVSTYM